MTNLDDLLTAYKQEPDNRTHCDHLLAAATRYCIAVARKLGHDDPEDIAQRAAMKLWECHASIHTSGRHWLSQAVRRLVIDDSRKQQPDYLPMPQEIVIGDDPCPPPTRDIMTLPVALRKVAAALMMGYSLSDTADITGISRRSLSRMLATRKPA